MGRVVVDVMPKPEILDPQGKAVAGALARLGFREFAAARQGKRFELEVEGEVTDEVLERAREAARTLLSNPVIEDVVRVAAGMTHRLMPQDRPSRADNPVKGGLRREVRWRACARGPAIAAGRWRPPSWAWPAPSSPRSPRCRPPPRRAASRSSTTPAALRCSTAPCSRPGTPRPGV